MDVKEFDRNTTISYLEYLQKHIKDSYDFFDHIITQIKRLDFDDESGSEIVKSAEGVAMSMKDVLSHFESLAKTTDDLSSKESQRDVKINKVLRK